MTINWFSGQNFGFSGENVKIGQKIGFKLQNGRNSNSLRSKFVKHCPNFSLKLKIWQKIGFSSQNFGFSGENVSEFLFKRSKFDKKLVLGSKMVATLIL